MYSLFTRLSAFNVAWTELSVTALNTLCTELPSSIQRINISGCRKTLNDNRMYCVTIFIFIASYRTGILFRLNMKSYSRSHLLVTITILQFKRMNTLYFIIQ